MMSVLDKLQLYEGVLLIEWHTTGAIAPTPPTLVHMRLLLVSTRCSPLLGRSEL
jgi:hypothetical protein